MPQMKMILPSRLDQAPKMLKSISMGDSFNKQQTCATLKLFWLWTLAVTLTWNIIGWGQSTEFTNADGIAFIEQYCIDCHQPPKPKGKLDLSTYTSIDQIVADALDWDSHLHRVRDEDMPPDDEDVDQPSIKDRMAFVDWMQDTLRDAACSDGIQPGPPMVRRLNQGEYSASVRALLDVHFDAGKHYQVKGRVVKDLTMRPRHCSSPPFMPKNIWKLHAPP
jgi:hypothetical protein